MLLSKIDIDAFLDMAEAEVEAAGKRKKALERACSVLLEASFYGLEDSKQTLYTALMEYMQRVEQVRLKPDMDRPYFDIDMNVAENTVPSEEGTSIRVLRISLRGIPQVVVAVHGTLREIDESGEAKYSWNVLDLTVINPMALSVFTSAHSHVL